MKQASPVMVRGRVSPKAVPWNTEPSARARRAAVMVVAEEAEDEAEDGVVWSDIGRIVGTLSAGAIAPCRVTLQPAPAKGMVEPSPYLSTHGNPAKHRTLIMPEVAATIHEYRTVTHHPELSHGWPTIGRRRNGELLVVYSGGREMHVCPFGRVELTRSSDHGQSWSEPVILADGPIDDRDAGVLETQKGTILVNWFTSLAWEVRLKRMEAGEAPESHYPRNIEAWKKIRDGLTDEIRRHELGGWAIRSEDGGQTWSERIDTLVNSPHGPTELRDGRLLYIGRLVDPEKKSCHRGSPFVREAGLHISESRDDGKTWQLIGEVPVAADHEASAYHEPYAVEAADGRIVGVIRNHNEPHKGETLQTESFDGGRTWTEPHSIGVWGTPAHLLRLQDDRLLLTHGYRQEPRGNRARVSEDHGQTWSETIVINDDGIGDLGYPSTVQLDDGSLVSVWYEQSRGKGTNTEVRMAHWSLD